MRISLPSPAKVDCWSLADLFPTTASRFTFPCFCSLSFVRPHTTHCGPLLALSTHPQQTSMALFSAFAQTRPAYTPIPTSWSFLLKSSTAVEGRKRQQKQVRISGLSVAVEFQRAEAHNIGPNCSLFSLLPLQAHLISQRQYISKDPRPTT